MERKIVYPQSSEIEETNKMAAVLFGTDEDKTQAQPTLENALRLIALEKNNFICLKEGGKIIAWSVVMPTSQKEMERFLKEEINEKELFEISIEHPSFEALYLMAVIVLPEYRKQGIGSSLMKQQIEYFKGKYGIEKLYAFVLTEEGKGLIGALEKNLQVTIPFLRKAG